MKGYSTRQVAEKLGLTEMSMSRYIAANKIPAPEPIQAGNLKVRLWSDADIERVRKILPKIANGRKSRYKKKTPKKKK
jgi:hypothetical protein